MKSLDIVNEKIEEAASLKGSYEQPVWEDETIINKEDLETIKQDLEVLEIIRNKRVNAAELVGELIYFDNDEDVLEDYNSIICKERQLRLTELLKLKKWLEENENDR